MLALYLTNFWQELLKNALFIIALCYVLRILIVMLHKMKRTTISHDDGPLFAFRSVTFLTLFALHCELNGFLDISEYLRQAVLTLFFCTTCSILEGIFRYGGVRHMIDNLIEYFLGIVDSAKYFFEKLGRFLCIHTTFMNVALVFLFVVASLLAQDHSETIRILIYTLAGFIAYCIYLAYALHSCRRLLLLLFVFAFLYALQVALAIEEFSNSQNGNFSFGIVVIAYVFLWIFTALVAEYEPAQMVFKIANTFTTLAAIAGNIFIPVLSIEQFSDKPFFPGYDNTTTLTIAFNLFILPLVSAGYLAQLAKDLYQYLKKKTVP